MNLIRIYGRVVAHERMTYPLSALDQNTIFSQYYIQRRHLIDRAAGKLVSLKISGTQYKRRVERINTWFDYKINTRYADLVSQALIGKSNGPGDLYISPQGYVY